MDRSYDVSDPTDWKETSLPKFAPVDAALRCQVCKDFYSNAVITSCFHTFCSLCIRRCLAADGKCPTCRTNEQETRLRRNVAVQEVTDSFVAARPDALKLAQKTEEEGVEIARDSNTLKRKRGENTAGDERPSQAPRRSQRLHTGDNKSPPANDTIMIDDNDNNGDGDYVPEDGLVPCPICNKRMKAESVFAHLDRCDEEMEAQKRPSRSSDSRSRTSTPLQRQQQEAPKPPPDRLPQLNYSLLKDNALRKKLSELGIPSWGVKSLLVRRHTEWINMWNANCDSAYPRSRKELLSELDAWERSQGGSAANGGQTTTATVMRKDFDGAGWSKKHKDDFDQLIANAKRKTIASPPSPDSNTNGVKDGDLSADPVPTSHNASIIARDLAPPAPPAPLAHFTSVDSLTSTMSNDNTTIHDRRRSISMSANEPPSIFCPPQRRTSITETPRGGAPLPHSPVPGFCFEKSQHYFTNHGATVPQPPCTQLFPNEPASSNGEGTNGYAHASTMTTATADGERAKPVSLTKQDSLPERITSSAGTLTKRPMFEVPGNPVMDAEMGSVK